MDSDRILVMDAGQVVEFDDPYILIKDDKSLLNAMVNQTGAATSKKLKSIAKKVTFILYIYLYSSFGILLRTKTRNSKIFIFRIIN